MVWGGFEGLGLCLTGCEGLALPRVQRVLRVWGGAGFGIKGLGGFGFRVLYSFFFFQCLGIIEGLGFCGAGVGGLGGGHGARALNTKPWCAPFLAPAWISCGSKIKELTKRW